MEIPQKNQQVFPFTDEQKKILNHPPFKHGRILAGPGTGKSTTAVALARELSSRDPVPRIKFLTFTRAATIELSKKIVAHEIYMESASRLSERSYFPVKSPLSVLILHEKRDKIGLWKNRHATDRKGFLMK